MISYAQNFEDVILSRVFEGRTSGFYIDVGAMHPVEGSVTKHFYDLGWNGINIEPDARFLPQLAAERPRDINLNSALSEREEILVFYEFAVQGISTFRPEYRQYFVDRGYLCIEREQQTTTLNSVCSKYARDPIDFMKIDVEGWESSVLKGNDWQRFRPCVLVIEACKPYSHDPDYEQWEPDLLRQGYDFVYEDGLNRFYVREESRDLKQAFRYPPNILDNFTVYATPGFAELQSQVQAEQQKVQNLESELNTCRALCAGHTSEITLLRTEVAAATSQREVERAAADHLRNELILATERADTAEATASQHQTALQQTATDNDMLHAQVLVLQQQVSGLTMEVATWKTMAGRISEQRAYLAGIVEKLRHAPADTANADLQHLCADPLRDSPDSDLAVRVKYAPHFVAPGQIFRVRAVLENRTNENLVSAGPNSVSLAYHWLDGAAESIVVFEGQRTALHPPLRRGCSREYSVEVHAPSEPGIFTLRVCVIQEMVRWFDAPASDNQIRIEVRSSHPR